MIQKCCPDMNLVINDRVIKDQEGIAYLVLPEELVDIYYCPFCGKEIVLIPNSGGTPT